MKLLKNNAIPTIIFLIMGLFIHCTSKFTITKEPVFKVDVNNVYSCITKLVTCEELNLSGKTITTNGIATSTLELNIINVKEASEDPAHMKVLGKSIASVLKASLTDPNQYNTYTILFVKKVVDRITTKEQWIENEFKSEEL